MFKQLFRIPVCQQTRKVLNPRVWPISNFRYISPLAIETVFARYGYPTERSLPIQSEEEGGGFSVAHCSPLSSILLRRSVGRLLQKHNPLSQSALQCFAPRSIPPPFCAACVVFGEIKRPKTPFCLIAPISQIFFLPHA